MARPREFDPEKTLQTAIEVFWENGYNATSVDEVIRRSGVAKYGIYGTFGTKRELFMTVLQRYARDRHADIQGPIRKPDAALPEILAFFEAVPRLVTDSAYPSGCLIARTGVELGAHDSEVRDFVEGFFRDTATALTRCLKRAVEKGQLTAPSNLSSLATYLVTEFRSALLLASGGCSRRDIERHLELVLKVLR